MDRTLRLVVIIVLVLLLIGRLSTTGEISVAGGAPGLHINETGFNDASGNLPFDQIWFSATDTRLSLHGLLAADDQARTITPPPGEQGNLQIADVSLYWTPLGGRDPNDIHVGPFPNDDTAGAIYDRTAVHVIPAPWSGAVAVGFMMLTRRRR